MRPCAQTPPSREGSIQPVVFALVLLLGLIGSLVVHQAQDRLLLRRAKAAAGAVAMSALFELYPAEYIRQPANRETASVSAWNRLRDLARANGVTDRDFYPLDQRSVRASPDRIEVSIHPRRPGLGVVQATAVAIPAARIRAGYQTRDPAGRIHAVGGCLPLGLQLAALPAPTTDRKTFVVDLTTEQPAGIVMKLPGSSGTPADQVAFLAVAGDQGSPGCPPPAVSVGDGVVPAEHSARFLAALAEGLVGRVVVVPLIHEDAIRGFGRVNVEAVQPDDRTVTLSLAPSAVSRSSGPGHRADRLKQRWPSVAPYGQVLCARLEG